MRTRRQAQPRAGDTSATTPPRLTVIEGALSIFRPGDEVFIGIEHARVLTLDMNKRLIVEDTKIVDGELCLVLSLPSTTAFLLPASIVRRTRKEAT